MKLKYLVGIGMVCSMICSCSEEYMSFEGTDRIQFKTKTEEVYTFAYYPESIQKDTLQIELISVGEVTDYPRTVRFEQVTNIRTMRKNPKRWSIPLMWIWNFRQ